MRIYPVECVRGKRAILYIRENSIRAVAVFRCIFFDSLYLFPWHPEARKYPAKYHARSCNRSRLECSSRERYSLVLRHCRFSKMSIGYVGDATPRRGRAAAGAGVYDNEFLGDSITRRWNSIGICRWARTTFSENYASPSLVIYIL